MARLNESIWRPEVKKRIDVPVIQKIPEVVPENKLEVKQIVESKPEVKKKAEAQPAWNRYDWVRKDCY